LKKDAQVHEGIKSVPQPMPRNWDNEPVFTKPMPPVQPTPQTSNRRPDPGVDFKKPFVVSIRPWPEDPPMNLLVLHPEGRVELGETLDAKTLWTALQGEHFNVSIIAACLSEISRLNKQVKALEKQVKTITRKNRRKS